LKTPESTRETRQLTAECLSLPHKRIKDPLRLKTEAPVQIYRARIGLGYGEGKQRKIPLCKVRSSGVYQAFANAVGAVFG